VDDTITDTVTEEPSRYLFDVSFDADQIARAEAEAKAKKEEPPEPIFTLLQIDEARKQGYDEGVLSGREEASSGIENSIGQTLERIAQQLPTIIQAQSAANEQMMANAAEIAVTVMRKLMPTLLERHGAAEIDALLSDCVSNLIDEPKIRIRVAADRAATVEERIEGLVSASGFDGRFLVEPDETMQPTDCCIDWPGGGVEKRSDEIWTQIDTALARFLAQYDQEGPAPAPIADDADQPTMPAIEDTTANGMTAQPPADTFEESTPAATEPLAEPTAEPTASHAADDTAEASIGPDDVATDGSGEPQDGVSPPDDETKIIDPEAPA
jgi:flagellar assembly protein FliH